MKTIKFYQLDWVDILSFVVLFFLLFISLLFLIADLVTKNKISALIIVGIVGYTFSIYDLFIKTKTLAFKEKEIEFLLSKSDENHHVHLEVVDKKGRE